MKKGNGALGFIKPWVATVCVLATSPIYSWKFRSPCEQAYETLAEATKTGDKEAFYKTLRGMCRRFIINKQDRAGRTPVFLATEADFLEGVDALLSYGADPNIPNLVGVTSLHIAAYFDNDEIAVKLIEHGANVNAQTYGHMNVPYGALLFGHPDESPIPGYAGRTALHEAARLGHSYFARVLLEHGADCRLREAHTNRTPRGEATHWHQSGAVDELGIQGCPF